MTTPNNWHPVTDTNGFPVGYVPTKAAADAIQYNWDMEYINDLNPDDEKAIATELKEQARLYGYQLSWDDIETEAHRISNNLTAHHEP